MLAHWIEAGSVFLWTSALLIVACFVKYWYLPWLRTWLALRSLPGPWDWIPMWHLIRTDWRWKKQLTIENFPKAAFISMSDLFKQYEGQTFQINGGVFPVVGIHTPEAAQAVLTGKCRKPVFYRFLRPWIGRKSILVMTGDAWKIKRKYLEQSLRTSALGGYLSNIQEYADALVARVELSLAKSLTEPIDCVESVHTCNMDVIWRSALGVGSGSEDVRGNYSAYSHLLAVLISLRMFQPWLWLDKIYNITHNGRLFEKTLRKVEDITQGVVKRRKRALQQLCGTLPAEEVVRSARNSDSLYLDSLLTAHMRTPSYTLEDVGKDVDSMFFAASDSTTCALSCCLYLLGLHPEKQRLVQKEVDGVMGVGACRAYTMAVLNSLQYMECCIKEAMRLFPPFPLIAALLDEDVTLDGAKLPKGLNCLINVFSLHRNPQQFDRPDEYIPERFMQDGKSWRHPFSYIPFSAGPKGCIGKKFAMMEMKVVLGKVLTKFSVEAARPLEEVQMTFQIALKPKGGLPLWFRPRGHS